MTKDDIIRMAQEISGVTYPSGIDGVKIGMSHDHLKRFADLVAAAEREECAKLCESLNEDFDSLHVESCAEAIRSRGEN